MIQGAPSNNFTFKDKSVQLGMDKAKIRTAPVHLTGLWSRRFDQVIRGQEGARRLKEIGYSGYKDKGDWEEVGRTRDFYRRLDELVLTKD